MNWVEFKSFVQSKSLSVQILVETDILIKLCAIADGLIRNECIIKKYDTVALDDFNTNFRSLANKALVKKDISNNPIIATAPFSSNENYEAKYQGFHGSIPPGSTASLDFKIINERYISGMQMIVKGAGPNDVVGLFVVDKDAVFYPTETVLKQFGETWGIDDQFQQQDDIEIGFVAKINAGLYLRFTYTNTGTNTVRFTSNTYLYQKT